MPRGERGRRLAFRWRNADCRVQTPLFPPPPNPDPRSHNPRSHTLSPTASRPASATAREIQREISSRSNTMAPIAEDRSPSPLFNRILVLILILSCAPGPKQRAHEPAGQFIELKWPRVRVV
jgi:hypothetical protein